jgi:hypothetical protein
MDLIRVMKRATLSSLIAACATLCLSSALATAEPEPAAAAPTEPAAAATAPEPDNSVIATVQLNKLEPNNKGCRAYMVVNNPTDNTYQALKLDLVLFQVDGVIGRRFALDLAPLKPKKKTVKLFEIDSITCDKIGTFLINDVMDCKTDAGPVENCLRRMTTSTLTNVQLSK